MYLRGSHEKYLKEIVDPVFEVYAIELLGSMSTWRHLCTLHLYPENIDLPGVCMYKLVMINWILQ